MDRNRFDRWLADPGRSPLIMGVLNVTPDSFSDGGRYENPTRAVTRALEMAAQGAAVVDIGGESTRPGSQAVADDEQIRRVVPVIEALHNDAAMTALISIDTTSAAVAAAALDAGATLINDVSAGTVDPDMLPLAASRQVPIILMHMQGTPRSMQVDPQYDDVVADVQAYLLARAEAARAAGVRAGDILLDVGIGFGKTLEHNLALLRAMKRFAALPYPHVLGVSRKRFIGTLTDEPVAERRVMGTAAAVAWGVTNGAAMVRVHDVEAMRSVVQVAAALRPLPADQTPQDD